MVSPAYDSLTPEQRHQYAAEHPDNYLNAMRSLEEFPEHERPRLDDLLERNAAVLRRFVDRRLFLPVARPSLYLYRMRSMDTQQTGVVGRVSIDEYDRGRLKIHESTRSDREDRLTRYLERVGAASSPVCLAYRQSDSIDALVEREVRRPPALRVRIEDGVTHTVWRLDEDAVIATLSEAFATIPAAYLTDGHHRAAATSRFAEKMREQGGNAAKGDDQLLVALFPHDQLRIQPFHRCVRDLNGHTDDAFLAGLSDAFTVHALGSQTDAWPRPEVKGEFAMRLDAAWYRLAVKPELLAGGDASVALDVNVLQTHVLGPTLGIRDPRSDPRLDYLSGELDEPALERLRAAGWRLTFAACPTSIEELMAVADAGKTMPPKSTFFTPKVRSGIFLCLRDASG